MATVRLTRYEAQEGRLPRICMVCGQAASQFRHKTMYWHPPWVFVLLLLGLLPFAIAALLTQQRLRLYAPLCANHQHHWLSRSLTIWLSLLGFVILGIGSFIFYSLMEAQQRRGRVNDAAFGFFCIGSLVLLVIWLVLVFVMQLSAVRPKEISDRHIILTGVAGRFIDALEDPRYFPDREYEDYPEEPPRRRRRPPPLPPDSFEERE